MGRKVRGIYSSLQKDEANMECGDLSQFFISIEKLRLVAALQSLLAIAISSK
jgi:hypothetical protein